MTLTSSFSRLKQRLGDFSRKPSLWKAAKRLDRLSKHNYEIVMEGNHYARINNE